MDTQKFLGLVLLLILLVFSGELVDAQDSYPTGNIQTNAITNVRNGTDDGLLMIRTFNDCSFLIQPISIPGFESMPDEVSGSSEAIAVNGSAPAFLVASGGFACGPDIGCNPATQYCNILIGGPKGVPSSYSCVDVSDVGSRLTCETIPNIGIGCECTEADGEVTVTCTAP